MLKIFEFYEMKILNYKIKFQYFQLNTIEMNVIHKSTRNKSTKIEDFKK